MGQTEVHKNRVAIYRQYLLPLSETFVAEHAMALENWDAKLFGLEETTGGVSADSLPRHWAPQGTRVANLIQADIFKVTGRHPGFRKSLVNFDPDLIVAHFLQDAFRIKMVAHQVDTPVIAVCHGSDVLLKPNMVDGNRGLKKMRRGWPASVDHVERFFAVSQYLREALISQGIAESRVVAWYLGVQIPREIQPESMNTVLFVGRLVDNKGWHNLLTSVLLAKNWGRTIPVTVVGDGPDRNAFLRTRQELDIEKEVNWIPSLSHMDVLRQMRKHSVVVVPSVDSVTGRSEGLGRVACEAAAVGRPVVCFRTGGLPEAVENDVSGFVVAQGSNESLARSLLRLLNDEKLRQRFGHEGRVRAMREFDIEKQAKLFESSLDEILAGNKNRGRQ